MKAPSCDLLESPPLFFKYAKGSMPPLILSLVANPGPHEAPFPFSRHHKQSLSSLLPEHRDFVPRCPFFWTCTLMHGL